MDIFIEKIVERKKSLKDKILSRSINIGGLILAFIVFMLDFGDFNFVGTLLIIALVYFSYRLSTLYNIEHEYAVTNTDLDIDKIISKRTRKRVLSLNIPSIEKFGPSSHAEFERCNRKDVKIYRCDSNTDINKTHFISFVGKDGKHSLLIFEPDEKMIEAFHKYAKYKVIPD